MAAEQTRLDYYDLENKHLDAPVDMPKKKDAKGIDQPVFDESVYFRPPPGIQRTPDANPVPGTNLSYRYPSKNSTCLFQEVRLAVAGLDAKDFEKDIVQPFPGLGGKVRISACVPHI